jgi:hypothetical protein
LPSAIPLLLFLMITMAANVQARPLAEEPGWRARVGLVVGFASRRSQFDTDSGNRVTSNLANPGQRSERGLLFPLARIDYTLPGLSTQFFLGNSRDQVSRAQFQYELGLTHRFADDSRLTLAWFPELPFLDETWQDPYLVGSPRQETDERFQGARVAFERIAGSRLTLKYAYAESDVELERSGAGLGLAPSERALLRRDSRYHRVEGELNLPLGDGWSWRPALQLTDAQADGEASSYEEAVLRLGLDGRRGRHGLVANATLGRRDHERANPVFGQATDSTRWGLFAIYTFAKPFGWERTGFNLIAGYRRQDADVTFHDSRGGILAAGLAYRF